MQTWFLCGVGGSGMSALAQLLLARGDEVRGSDRAYDRQGVTRLYRQLQALGVRMFPQDGSGIGPEIGALVVSSAIEDSAPDVAAALAHGVSIQKRAEVLAGIFNRGFGIAVGGTSGKTTITGMIGHILREAGQAPTVVNGGIMLNVADEQTPGNLLAGAASGPMVVEADESDGTIDFYNPAIAVVSNITLDHRPLAELRELFSGFCRRARQVVLNADCPECAAIAVGLPAVRTFSLGAAADFAVRDLVCEGGALRFSLQGESFCLSVPGAHNAANAAAAVAAVSGVGVSVATAAAALRSYRGTHRRLEMVGTGGGVRVIDDFAHNPDKIAASLAALTAGYRRLRVCFQPHGFGPTRFLRRGLVQAFVNGLREDDWLVMPEIYYAGGTVTRDISAADLIDEISGAGRQARFFPERQAAGDFLLTHCAEGDALVVMGARDASLTDFAGSLLASLVRKAEEAE